MKKEIIMKRYLHFLLILCFSNSLVQATSSAVTFERQGRLGDLLLKAWQTKYFAQKYKLTFLCPQFSFLNNLVLGLTEKKYTADMDKQFTNVIHLTNDFSTKIEPDTQTLYVIKSHFTSKHGLGFDDSKMINIMKNLIKPVTSLKTIKLKKNCINVALHVRRGSGGDGPFHENQKKWPTKFPPDSYYLEALRKLSTLYNHQAIHVHIFTDIKNPNKIANKFSKKLALNNISFSYRANNENAHKDTVLNDLFSMVKCDALIRGTSGFAKIAHYIGNHRVVIVPKLPMWKKGILYIKELEIINRL